MAFSFCCLFCLNPTHSLFLGWIYSKLPQIKDYGLKAKSMCFGKKVAGWRIFHHFLRVANFSLFPRNLAAKFCNFLLTIFPKQLLSVTKQQTVGWPFNFPLGAFNLIDWSIHWSASESGSDFSIHYTGHGVGIFCGFERSGRILKMKQWR